LITTFDHHFAGSLFRQVPRPGNITYLELKPRSTLRDSARIARHRMHIDRLREAWVDDDHDSERIKDFCAEARRTLEGAFRDLIWPGRIAVAGDETMEPLRAKLSTLTQQAGIYANKIFKDLCAHAAFGDQIFREGINWAAHFPADQLSVHHARQVDQHLGALLKLVDAGQAYLDEALTRETVGAGAAVIPFPMHHCPVAFVPEIGRAAAQDGRAVDNEAVTEASGPVRLVPNRHQLLVVGRGLDWLPGLLSPGDLVIVDGDEAANNGLALVWDNERGTPYLGWLQPVRGMERRIVLHGVPVQPGSKQKSFARIFDLDRCTTHTIAGILFGRAPAPAKPLDFHEDDDPFAGIEGAILIDAGMSAAPALIPGNHILVGPPLPEIGSTRSLKGKTYAVRLSNGEKVVKRIGHALDRAGAVRMLERIGEEGEDLPARLTEEASTSFAQLPSVEEMRPVLGYWFAAGTS
jgi:hypothetical protein